MLGSVAEKVLRTASKLGIKRYRLGFIRYARNTPIPQTLREVAAWFKDLAALNKQRFNLLFLDLTLPDGSADDVYDAAKEIDPELPIG